MENNFYKIKDTNFHNFCNYIKAHCGINLTSEKRFLVEGRLQKVAKTLNYKDTNQLVIDFLNNKLNETHHSIIIDAITTNTTDFFREPYHFEYLSAYVSNFCQRIKHFTIWCAASSTGEEPYSIAITLSELKNNYNFTFNILATDISEKVLQTAKAAIYNIDKIKNVPIKLVKKYFMVSKTNKDLFKVVPEIRKFINFEKLNLTSDYNFTNKFDVIFLRNVLIYFDDFTKYDILKKITNFMYPNSILFLGHSETITNKNLNLQRIQNTIYKLKQ